MNIRFPVYGAEGYRLFPEGSKQPESAHHQYTGFGSRVEQCISVRQVTENRTVQTYINSSPPNLSAKDKPCRTQEIYTNEAKLKLQELINNHRRLKGIILSYDQVKQTGVISFYVQGSTFIASFSYDQVENYSHRNLTHFRTLSKNLKPDMCAYFFIQTENVELDPMLLKAHSISISS